MFAGHLAVALGGKAAAPRTPLWALVGASFALDLLWPVLLLAGVETVRVDPGNTAFTPLDFVAYPWSHSLAMVLLWAVLAGMAARALTGSARQGAVVGALLASHWLLDFVTHAPDLPVWPGGPRVGLGLWASVPATLVVEGALLALGVGLYARVTRPTDRTGSVSLALLVGLVALIWASGPFAPPPPPSTAAIAGVGLALLLLLPLAAWVERHRRTETARG